MRILCFIFTLTLKGISGFSQQIPTGDYEVYSDIIRTELVASTTVVVVVNELVNEQDSKIVASALSSNDLSTLASISHEYQFDSASVNALNNYFSRDTTKITLENKFLTPIPVRTIANEAFDAYFKKG
ncbi:hypothetical protein ACFQ48_09170 [Hymenobacter caeli]|uniref:DUF4476 domain-containing protein n=1 Tax=Hymenobacter caeli TaxID=2735894 RepID=A0ABX2FM48_9BACT|nr:hypothetical protein [Hymenobacter caeli]NRT18238.1 hypothetical protein [Hymenobacter caeli]